MTTPSRSTRPSLLDALDRELLTKEFHRCSLRSVGVDSVFTVAGLFAGIGGIEVGLSRAGGSTQLLCENWEPAKMVLRAQFPEVPVVGDVRQLKALPKVDVVTAGFPCTDLSQAGRTRGIEGRESGLISEVFRLLQRRRASLLVLENVRNMLALDRGRAMRYLVTELESLGYRWAYRLVDSRFTGVPQRRQRVILVAARDVDPRAILFADDAGEPLASSYRDDCFGFYWTEGLRGLGWARDAVPTLKGGSTVGILSPPAIWWPRGELGQRLLVPSIGDAEGLQGFRAGWTVNADGANGPKGTRWKLVGNAVTVGVSTWLGRRIRDPAEPCLEGAAMQSGDRWPAAAFGAAGKVWAVEVSMWPVHQPYRHLSEIIDLHGAAPLSARGAAGFLMRARRAKLRFVDQFLADVERHVDFMSREVAFDA
jgi:DNA (cytosine-5)-methyltransferase 1